MTEQWPAWLKRLCVALILAFGIGYGPRLLDAQTESRIVTLRKEQTRLSARILIVRRAIVDLKTEVTLFQRSKAYQEMLVREELGLVRSGDIVIRQEGEH